MSGYVATINVPGYLPMDDDPPIFETAQEAWDYFANERAHGEVEETYDAGVDGHNGEYGCTLSPALHDLIRLAESDNPGEGCVYGDTPGYDGDHDLGLAYCVTYTDETPEEV